MSQNQNRQGTIVSVAIVTGMIAGILVFALWPPMTRADHDINIFGVFEFFRNIFRLTFSVIAALVGATVSGLITALATRPSKTAEVMPRQDPPAK